MILALVIAHVATIAVSCIISIAVGISQIKKNLTPTPPVDPVITPIVETPKDTEPKN